jgi:aromatic ring hydroxylase
MSNEHSLFSSVKRAIEDDPSYGNLRSQYDLLTSLHRLETEKMNRLYGEICYLLAQAEMKRNNRDAAKAYADKAISAYERVRTNTLEDVVTVLNVSGIPEYMHEGVIKDWVVTHL